MKKLSIIIPAYNEEKTLAEIVRRVDAVPLHGLEKEIIIVNDGSTDGTKQVMEKLGHCVAISKDNGGKGSAVKTGLMLSTGDLVIIQDADLEYDPSEYEKILTPMIEGDADVVFGSRFIGGNSKRVLYYWHSLGNRFLTLFSNMLTNINLTDMETCYKAMTREVVEKIAPEISSKRFGIEPEITALVSKYNFRIYEVGISYKGRSYKEGKKINWKDGVAAIWHIIKFNIIK